MKSLIIAILKVKNPKKPVRELAWEAVYGADKSLIKSIFNEVENFFPSTYQLKKYIRVKILLEDE